MNRNIFYKKWLILVLFLGFGLTSCDDDEVSSVPLEASFDLAVNSESEVDFPVEFTNNSKGAFSYLWSFGDGTVSTAKSPTKTYSKSGDYLVSLEVSGNGFREVFSRTITIAPTSFELYFIDNDELKIRKISLADTTVSDVFDLPGFSFGLAYDETNQNFYFSDDDVGAVYKNNLAGTAEEEILGSLGSPRAIALDMANNRAFVADRSRDEIVEIDLSDNSSSIIYSVSDNADFLLPVGLDYYAGNLYATCIEVGAETVWKGAGDGTSLENIIDFGAGGFGYGIAVDEANEKIYFDNNDGNQLLRANLDGSNIENFGSTSDRNYGIAISQLTGAVYWVGRNGIIYTSNAEGETIVLKDIGSDIRGLIIRRNN